MFKPVIFETLKTYNRQQFAKDALAGLIVGIVALPLAIAFAIASGVSPEKGLYTAVIAGFIISALGGSRVQIGGPTGAFIVIVYGIVQVYGVNGLIIATFMAGVLLIIMGLARIGAVIKFIPYPLIVGFTSGIAVIIFSSEMKDFFGLKIANPPADFIQKWKTYFTNFHAVNWYALLIAMATVLIIVLWPKVTRRIPGSLVAILVTTAVMQSLHLPVETIGSRFGNIPSSLPAPSFPHLDLTTIQHLVQPAFTIALLGAIESLLSAVVADGMTGGHHKSNMELVAQGAANIFSSIFGGIPATGAIARTATNIKSGGRTPVAGIVHALTLLLIMLLIGRQAALIPMPTLAGILVVVAYHMSEWESFRAVLKGPKTDIAILLVTFFLTILVDLTAAIEIGMVMAAFLFMHTMIKFSSVNVMEHETADKTKERTNSPESYILPAGVEVFEITGPLFFGAVYKFKEAMQFIENKPGVLIIRMRQVPFIDATGIKTLKDICKELKGKGTKLILSEVENNGVMAELDKARLLFQVGKANVTASFKGALKRSEDILTGN